MPMHPSPIAEIIGPFLPKRRCFISLSFLLVSLSPAAESAHPRFDRGDTVRHEPRQRLETTFLGERALGHDHRRGAAVQTRCVAGRDRAVLRKAGFSLASVSIVVSGRLASSLSKLTSPLRLANSIATISSLNFPASCAALKRCCERAAQRSWSSRVTRYVVTRSSVCQPECCPLNASFKPSRSML